MALVFLMGGFAGIAAGFFGGWTDRIVGRIADTIMAFPLFVLAMGIVAALGNTVTNIVIATAIINFPLYARVARAEANVRRDAGFVQAARLSGNGELRILLAQILPNIMPIMMVQMSLTMGYAILNAAGLSFIGLGVRPPTPEWGIMVAEGAAFIMSGEWWIAFFPGRRADDRGVLLQPARRRPARHRRSAAADLRQMRSRMTAQPLLDVHDLTVEFATRRGIVSAVQHVNITVAKGETLGIVGESGSGKSVTSYAVMRILDRAGKIAEGSVMFSGIDVKRRDEDRDARSARPRNLDDLPEPARRAQSDPQGRRPDRGRAAAARAGRRGAGRSEQAIEALEQVRIARPRERYHAYPFELSGGMCQRVVIALALACNPQLLIADEPTTGLDVTTQKAVMDLIVELTSERGMSTILITHDLGLAAAYCDRVVVMEKGRVVETATSATIFASARARLYPEADARDAAARRLACAICCRRRKPRRCRRLAPPPMPPPTAPQAAAARSKSWSRNIRARAPTASLGKLFGRKPPVEPRACSAPSTASASRSAMARASGWSANPAAANRPRR